MNDYTVTSDDMLMHWNDLRQQTLIVMVDGYMISSEIISVLYHVSDVLTCVPITLDVYSFRIFCTLGYFF